MSAPGPVENPNKKSSLPVVFIIGLIAFVIFGILYTTAVLFGQITDKQKIDTINLSLIALVLLAILILSRPRIFEQLSLVEILGIKLQIGQSHGETGTAANATAGYKFNLASPDSAIRTETPSRAWK
jgi:hypothetical protein